MAIHVYTCTEKKLNNRPPYIPLSLTSILFSDKKALGLEIVIKNLGRNVLFRLLVSVPLEKKTGAANMDKQMLVNLKAAFH